MSICPTRTTRLSVALLTLLLVMGPRVVAAEENTFAYTVQPGDSAWTIAARYLREPGHWQALRQANRLQGDRLAPGQVLRIPMPWLRVTTQEARLATTEGEVMLNSGTGWTPAQADTVLAPGTWLRTPAEGTATLLIRDGTRVLVRPSSELRLLALDRTQLDAWLASGADQHRKPRATPGQPAVLDLPVRIELLRGGLENAVQPQPGQGHPRFEVRTPSAVTTVRGTEFRVSTDDTGSRAEVLRGAVGLHNPHGQVELPTATGSQVARSTGPIAPVPLLPAPVVEDIPARLSAEQARTHRVPAVAGATAYRVQWFSGDTPARLRLLHEAVSESPVLAFPERPDGEYRVRLRAIDAIGLEGLSAEHALVVDTPAPVPLPPPPPPPPEPPRLDVIPQGQRIELVWTPFRADSSTQVQIARDEAFTQVVLDEPTPGHRLSLPLPPGSGHARVRELRIDGTRGPWSSPQRLTTHPRNTTP